MRVDRKFIEMGLYGGTLNKAQFEILGQPYLAVEGWESLVVDREISQRDANLFLFLRGKLSLKVQEQIIKNYQLVVEFTQQTKMKKENPKVIPTNTLIIYCDGACKGNPGKAGSGLAIYSGADKPILLYGKYAESGTNNTAELNALHQALLIASESATSTIYSDSKYSIDCITKWAYGWKSKGWTKKGGEIKNLELIKLVHELYESIKDRVVIKHIKGHSGVEGNELADRMAVYAITSQSGEYQEYDYANVVDLLGLSDG